MLTACRCANSPVADRAGFPPERGVATAGAMTSQKGRTLRGAGFFAVYGRAACRLNRRAAAENFWQEQITGASKGKYHCPDGPSGL
ncbi:hypothetical protein A6M21_00170 [Desulfotomaculum copahuensis]|uniref:Uncharacterized protein n=1 Tax=Desulfotomaculum copahuensis TaxID=1838280 RepID=A0A1B7LDS2_9FIRM|nr:hypothetical protein A6M21_00170 [Desulfotomaculum copahuensis]